MNSIEQFARSIKGTKITSVRTITVPDMLKRNNPFYGSVIKVTDQNMLFGGDYKKACDKGLKKQGIENPDYQVKDVWHKHVDNCPALVTDKRTESKLYLFGRVIENPKTGKIQSKARYLMKLSNGKFVPIQKSMIESFLKKKKPSDFKPTMRTFELGNVVRVKCLKEFTQVHGTKLSVTREKESV
jgi:hypothetical protein